MSKSIRRAILRRVVHLRTKAHNRVKDMHNKTTNFLVSNFDTILLPTFNTKQMVKRDGRKINKSVARSLNALSHYAFKQHLIHACERTGVTLHIVDEAYTTKTCGKCGELNDVGSNKKYTCEHCHIVLDRDMNAARNIGIKNIGLVPPYDTENSIIQV